MARTDNLTNFLTDVADAIRDKKGTSDLILASNFDTEIESIESGGGSNQEIDDLISGTIVELYTDATRTRTNCFYQCNQLIKIDFSSLTSIAAYSFRNCSKLSTVIIRTSSVCSLGNVNAFNGTPIGDLTGYIYVPDNLVSTYQSATNWSEYGSQIKGISEF